MEVYIEYVIIDSFIINWLLLWSAVKTMGLKFNWFLCLISSLFGTIVSCLVPLINFSGIALFIIKLILGLLMVLMCYKYKSFKQCIYTFMIFVSYTFLMGGACYAVIILLGGTFENITIGNNVTTIGDFAFNDCKKLNNITLPDGVITIGANAFEYCESFTDITIPDGVTTIGDYAFAQCPNIKNITVPDSVTSIRREAFYGCINLIIHTSSGSYAETYAKKKKIPVKIV